MTVTLRPPAGMVRFRALDFHHAPERGGRLVHTHLGQVVHDHKYWRPSREAVALLAGEVNRLMEDEADFGAVEIILTAPPNRRRWRRLRDLPLCVGRQVAAKRGIACPRPGIVRVRRTPLQKGLETAAQSHTQIRDAFALRADVAGRCVLLLDDLVGWGGTMAAMSACTRAGDPRRLLGLALTATRHATR